MRGRQVSVSGETVRERKIPARAGTTRRGRPGRRPPREDPRACGDDATTVATLVRAGGRSPRVRGRRPCSVWRHAQKRKIPARAGTTRMSGARTAGCQEDPRACGDDHSRCRVPCGQRGRSPRVRGRLPRADQLGPGSRKIPARAGTTRARPRCRQTGGEDPRACGDDEVPSGIALALEGRSPRVRGRPSPEPWSRPRSGKIPARAGTTSPSRRREWYEGEDPRACGDDCRARISSAQAPGRSPRVRGRHTGRASANPGPRKIPARAGTTSRPLGQ